MHVQSATPCQKLVVQQHECACSGGLCPLWLRVDIAGRTGSGPRQLDSPSKMKRATCVMSVARQCMQGRDCKLEHGQDRCAGRDRSLPCT